MMTGARCRAHRTTPRDPSMLRVVPRPTGPDSTGVPLLQFAGSPAAGCTSASSSKCSKHNGLDMAVTVFSYLPVPGPSDYSDVDPPPSCPSNKKRKALRGDVHGRVYEITSQQPAADASRLPSPSSMGHTWASGPFVSACPCPTPAAAKY